MKGMAKGMAMRRVMRRWERIRGARIIAKGSLPITDDMRPPLLTKRPRQSTSSSSDDEAIPLADSSNKASCVPLALTLHNHNNSNSSLACVGFGKRRKSLVTLLVGKERQVFKVEPQMMEHRLLECLLERTRSKALTSPSLDSPTQALWADKENEPVHTNNIKSGNCPIFLDCDAILFEHILWLLNNDDPAIRQLNIEELMEFYE